MKLKQSRSTKLANHLIHHLEKSKRDFTDVIIKIAQNKESYYRDGYQIYGKCNDRTVRVYGHINFDKYLVEFPEHKKTYETNDLQTIEKLIISYLYLDDSDELLNKILKKGVVKK